MGVSAANATATATTAVTAASTATGQVMLEWRRDIEGEYMTPSGTSKYRRCTLTSSEISEYRR